MADGGSNKNKKKTKTSTKKNSTSLTMPKKEQSSEIKETKTKENKKEKLNNKKPKAVQEEKKEAIANIEPEEIVKEVNGPKPKLELKWIVLSISWILIIFTDYLLFPKFELLGQEEIIINYNETYSEPGYKAHILSMDISDKITTNSNVENGKLGEYHIDYLLKYGYITLKKKRNIKVVDNIPPIIEGVEAEIKMCPNKEIDSIEYAVTDEYDGNVKDISSINVLDDKIIITARDKSKNEIIKEVKVIKEDTEKPKITLKGYQNVYLVTGAKYQEYGYSATDNCDGDLTDKVVVNGTVGTGVGTYKITYSVTDNSGNKEEIVRTVIIRNNNLYNSGTIGNGTIYLTFDDGPNSGTTNVILDVLKETGIKATFFVTCNGPDSLIKRIYDEGHTVALHTASHNYAYIYSSVDNYFADLNRVATRVKNITGYDAKIIRFPGGSSNTVSRSYQSGIMTTLTNMVLDKGYRYFDWNVDAMDASSARSSNDVYNNVTRNLSKSRSNVVLMHDTKTITRDAVRSIINYGLSQGYSFSRIENDTYMIRHSVNN